MSTKVTKVAGTNRYIVEGFEKYGQIKVVNPQVDSDDDGKFVHIDDLEAIGGAEAKIHKDDYDELKEILTSVLNVEFGIL
jgi:hypothetical protein